MTRTVVCAALLLSCSRVPPVVKLLQAAGGMDGAPVEASAGAELTPFWSCISVPAAVPELMRRSAAAAKLMSMFWRHALLPAWGNVIPQGWQQQLSEHQAAVSRQQQMQAHPVVAAAAVGGMQGQVLSLLGYLAQQHNQPEMYCMDAEALSRSC